MGKTQGYPTAGLVLLVILLTIMWIHASSMDIKNTKIFGNEITLKTYENPISFDERSRVEQILRDYRERRSLNKSYSNKIVIDTIIGAIRGGLGGAVLGGESGIVPGMIAFGTLSGILSWSREILPSYRFRRPLDKSAY
jgi:hypothetical protein